MNRGKEIVSQRSPQTYKSAIAEKDEKILRNEALKATPEDKKLREDAYNIALKSNSVKEYIYPYIPITTIWISPIEEKYLKLSAEEVMNFYLRSFTDPYLFPKDFLYYQNILSYTGSIQFDFSMRSGNESAFSKATIKRILLPEQWDGDLIKEKKLFKTQRILIGI